MLFTACQVSIACHSVGWQNEEKLLGTLNAVSCLKIDVVRRMPGFHWLSLSWLVPSLHYTLLPVEAWEPPSPEKAVRRPRTLAARLDCLSRSRHGLSWTGRGQGRRLACVPRSFLPISGSSRAQLDAYDHLLRTQGSSRLFHSRVRSRLEITSRCSSFLGGGGCTP